MRDMWLHKSGKGRVDLGVQVRHSAHTYNLSIFQAKTERAQVQGQPRLHSEDLFQTKQNKKSQIMLLVVGIINMVLEAAIYCC